MTELNLKSLRARKALLSNRIGKLGFEIMVAAVWLFGALAVYFLWQNGINDRAGMGLLALTLLIFALAMWDRWDLQKLPPAKSPKTLDDVLEGPLLAGLKKAPKVSPHTAWKAAASGWQTRFLCAHLLLDIDSIAQTMSDNEADMPVVWRAAQDIMDQAQMKELHGGIMAAALFHTSATTKSYLSKLNIKIDDVFEVVSWMERVNRFLAQPRPYFGGIGRDWATGFTPMLDRFGTNISRQVEAGGGYYHTLAHGDILDSIIHNLDSGAVNLVGEAGVGKTSLVYALAERLLLGQHKNLQYYQIISLNASTIISEAKDSLERIMLALFSEASQARNVIVFLDNSKLFFDAATGSFDASRVLLPLLQSQGIKVITALTPDDFQELKSTNSELFSYLPTVVVTQPQPSTTMQILEDTTLGIEHKNNIIVSYQALKEAYRLSGEYMQDLAYPGRAISVLEQAVPYVQDRFMTMESVQLAVEKTKGVKVSNAAAPEADTLLHLEARIHQRMVNQERAVKVVSDALRRGRAGVSDPKRPIGSFLFLGPTGVGKTELARSLAAIYFGDERQMIRLDMSEYQQESDVERMLGTGADDSRGLIVQIREQPFAVVLLDEVEKAHPNILNLLLQLLDEGQLTDEKGHVSSFRNAIIITTSNAGAVEITQRVAAGDKLESFERPLIQELMDKGQFKPELINRFDEITLFRPLSKSELAQVASLMLEGVNQTLARQNISVKLTQAALEKVVEAGYDPQFGARPMRRALQKMVEDAVAKKVLSNEAQAGSTITLDVQDLTS